jgi:hypothetical protein
MIDLCALRSPNVVKIWRVFEPIGSPSTVPSVDIVV